LKSVFDPTEVAVLKARVEVKRVLKLLVVPPPPPGVNGNPLMVLTVREDMDAVVKLETEPEGGG
jgi:hypothetical protein